MKVLYLTKYSRNGASSRMRSFQYFSFLESKGICISQSSLFNEQYLDELYKGNGVSKLNILKCYLKRFFVLFTVWKYDKYVIEYELFPYLPAWAEQLFNLFGLKYIVDYDDAIFHNYDKSSNKFIYLFLSKKIDVVMKNAEAVVVGNSYLSTRAKSTGNKNVIIIPTVIDINRYIQKHFKNNTSINVGWIGTKSTYEKHLLPCMPWIASLIDKHSDISFRIICHLEREAYGGRLKYIKWHESTEINELLKLDVGIMPLVDSMWEYGKCSYKLIQYMACGIPVIASPIGMNKDVVQVGYNGFFAESADEWLIKILTFADNKELLQELGNNGRSMVESQFCIQKTAERWYKLLVK